MGSKGGEDVFALVVVARPVGTVFVVVVLVVGRVERAWVINIARSTTLGRH